MKRIGVLFSIVMALTVASIWFVLHREVEKPRREMGSTRYHPVSIEGFSTTVDGVGVAFDKFDVRKMKWGGITLGGFNVLEIENLSLTLHEGGGVRQPAKSVARESSDGVEGNCVELQPTMKDPVTLVRALVPTTSRFSGIRIRGMKILRARADGDPQPWLEASLVRNAGKELRISGLVEATQGTRHSIGEARLVVDHGYYLVNGTNAAERIRLL